MADPELRDLIKQIHDEAAILRAVAREADLEMAEYVAAARAKRESEQLGREDDEPGATERAHELGADP